jgi:hypothetical protein
MRRSPALPLLLVLAACAPRPAGPAAPIGVEQVRSATALDAAAARQAVVDVVRAYASSPTQGVGPLSSLVAGPDLASWVRWLDVQHREFAGTIEASADVRDVEFVTTIEAVDATGAQVGLSASVAFTFRPEGDAPFDRSRILDGLVTLVRIGSGEYRVVDFQRDGVPMSTGIEIFENEVRARGAAEVHLDSLFMFPPNWQFNVVVRNLGTEPMLVDARATGLYVESEDGFARTEGVITRSLEVVPPGAEVAGIVAVPGQDSAAGRTLVVAYESGRRPVRFEFPLRALVTAVPLPPPIAEGSAPGAAG